MVIILKIKIILLNQGIAQMVLGKIILLICRIYALEDTMIYEGMIFKANHNLFEVKII